ncbi:HNH endonuclease [Neorhodopirellula pilleata]|uniref:Putative HNH nuclease YajD n=1 Tax=Neorhodopirellula pilleata TaxID=2714738 RepID=A0A5C5ZV41_9BACT|nr:HNH endonuclease [Neorhodopirellula pilleata]TWT91461.1 HNH endonuclease [Neorhodopirellula pilleata]
MAVPEARKSCVICRRSHIGRGSRCDACRGTRQAITPAVEARPTAARRGYGRNWRRAAKEFLAEPANHICKECGERIASQVDHIVPHRGDPKLFWSRSNWQGLCHSCHSRKTARGA